MLLEPGSEASLGLFSMGRGSLTLVSMDRKVGPDLNTTLML